MTSIFGDRWLVGLSTFVAAAVAASLTLGGCHDGYDFSRNEYDRGTLGQELFKIWHEQAGDARHNPDDKQQMLEDNRRGFVRAVDTVAPPDKLEAVDVFFQRLLSTVDSGLLPPLTRKIRLAMQSAADTPELMAAMAGNGRPAPELLVHPEVDDSLTSYLASFEGFRPLTRLLVDVFVPADGFDARGRPASDESTSFRALQHGLADTLQAAQLPASNRTPGAVGLRDILLTEDARFLETTDLEGEPPLLAAQFDRRGYPAVDTSSGEPPFPFVDQNGDGLADVDDRGRFVFEDTENVRVAPFHGTGPIGPFGRDDRRRITTSEGPVFEYVDLTRTGLHFLLRKTAILHDDNVVWDLTAGLPALLGERGERSDDRGNYRGYSPDQPLTDLVHAGLNAVAIPKAPEVLEALVTMLSKNERELAEVGLAVDKFGEFADNYPNAELTDDETIIYDLLPVIEQISADPKLWADVMDALRKPVFTKLDESILTLLKYRNKNVVPSRDGPYDRCFQRCKRQYEARETDAHPNGIGLPERFQCIRGCPTDELFNKQTDFGARESRDNRSINQRIFHLLRDTSGVEYTLTMKNASISGIDLGRFPPLVRLPAAAEAFIATIAGNLKIKNYIPQDWNNSNLGTLLSVIGVSNADIVDLLSNVSGLFGAHLDPEPTPDQITRLFNSPDLKFETDRVTIDVTDPVCKDGYVMANHHADGLFAAEASGLIDAVQPLAKAFSDHGREDLLAQLFIIVHEHYSSHEALYKQKNGSPSPMKGANFVGYEPALRDAMDDGALIESLHEFARSADRLETPGQNDFEEQLRLLVHQATRTDQEITARDGTAEIDLPDGDTVPSPSRAHFLLRAVEQLGTRVSDDSEAQNRFDRAFEAAADLLLSLERDGQGRAGFAEPGTVALLSKIGAEIARSAREMRANGTLVDALSTEWPEAFASMISSRTTAGAVDLLEAVADDEDHRGLLHHTLSHLIARPDGRRRLTALFFQMTARQAAPENWVPVAHFLGDLLDPDRTWDVDSYAQMPLASHGLELLGAILELDDRGTGFGMTERALQPGPHGASPLSVLSTMWANYFRTTPTSNAAFRADDYKRLYLQLSRWLEDEARGLEQLYDIVELRR